MKINALTAFVRAMPPRSEKFSEFLAWLHRCTLLLKSVGINTAQAPTLVQTLLGPLRTHAIGVDDDVAQRLNVRLRTISSYCVV